MEQKTDPHKYAQHKSTKEACPCQQEVRGNWASIAKNTQRHQKKISRFQILYKTNSKTDHGLKTKICLGERRRKALQLIAQQRILRLDQKKYSSQKGKLINWFSSKLRTLALSKPAPADAKTSYRLGENICRSHYPTRTSILSV